MTAFPEPRSSILMLVDGLRPDMLGPCGNTWFDTSYINQLASESLMFETCVSDTPDYPSGLSGILRGTHAVNQAVDAENLIDQVGATGTESILISAEPEKFADVWNLFDRVVEVPVPAVNGELANDIESTQMAVFFAAAIDAIQKVDSPTILVLDCPGFVAAWDAPWRYRSGLCDSEDPVPSEIVVPPDFEFNAALDDPDRLLDLRFAYGGQVILFDQLLGIFREQLASCAWARGALFCLTATRGFPLGEHRVVGLGRQGLHNESINVPLFVRWPDPNAVIGRSRQLVQPGALNALLRDWHRGRDQTSETRSVFPEISATDLLPKLTQSLVVAQCSGADGKVRSIQTHAWKFISGTAPQLYVKPDDHWEFNDVSGLCPSIVEELDGLLQRATESICQGAIPAFELADNLGLGIE